jgi:phosphate:Na+ symporter
MQFLRGNWRYIIIVALILLLPAWAQASEANDIQWGNLTMGLLGGLALFLLGMEMMSEGLKRAAGNRVRSILGMLTHNRFVGLVAGALVTMVIQSSSATTVMLVSFVQAQLMTLTQSLGVILGADIGTTITAQLIAFKLTNYALLVVAAGFALRMFSKEDSHKNMGEALLGFGVLFFGMHLMSDAMHPLRTYEPFIGALAQLENPLIGILVGTLFTALIQSSSAFTGIVIVLASQGALTLEAGIPLILGANIGTCVTAGLSCLNTSREAKRVALAHVLFKFIGVLLFVFWIPIFSDLVRWVSVGAEMPRMIANAHTLFNVGFSLAFLPFLGLFNKLVMKLLPDQPENDERTYRVRHLDVSQLTTPATAIALALSEIRRVGQTLQEMLQMAVEPFLNDSVNTDPDFPELTLEQGIEMRGEKVNYLVVETETFVLQLSRQQLSIRQADEATALLSIVNDTKRIADLISRIIMPLLARKRVLEVDFTEEGKEEIKVYHTKMSKQLSRLNELLSGSKIGAAERILQKDSKYEKLEAELRLRHLARCQEQLSGSLVTHEIHMELMDQLRHIGVYAANIARAVLRARTGEEQE